jgi:hypothetical protein
MRKKILIIVLILATIITIFLIVRHNYNLSPEYNYITAKLDIKNGNCRIVHTGEHIISLKDQEIEAVAAKYGFRNVYIEKPTSNELNGINNYNKAIEIYLTLRNGYNWKANYQNEIDSILMRAAPPENNKKSPH